MWSVSLYRPLGSLSARRLTLFVSALLVALLAALTISTTPAQAQTPREIATWSGENIEYGGQALERFDRPPALTDERFPNRYNTPCKDSVPLFYSQPLDGPAAKYGDPEYSEDRYWTHIICLAEGSDSSDTSQPINAILLDFSTPKEGIEGDKPTGSDFTTFIQHSIKIYPEGTDPSTINGNTTSITTCDSAYTHGLGWIICPVTNWLADTMDRLYSALSSFLAITPLSTARDNVMYAIWDEMRNIANVLFIAGFLFIIYSQITNVGLSNYGLKRLLPRLIIAAMLVNVSYWISAAAIDVSNILGVSLKDGIDSIREGIPSSSGRDLSEWTWSGLAGVILSGGAATFAGVTAVAGVVASAGGSLWFLLVGLAGVILAGLVAILVLAARQALITILVIVSPLAFAAYLLPSTEKYFDKWKDLFMTTLLVYPIFSVIFGGAQLAGLAIIESADPDSVNYFNVVILGMIVQVAPVIITPLLIKLSGSLIGRVAGFANNPNRGIIDQTRKYAQGRADMTKKSQIGKTKDGKFAHNNPLALAARWNSNREIDKTRKLKAYETGIEAAYETSSRSHATHSQSAVNEMLKSTGTDDAKASFSRDLANQQALRRLYYKQQSMHEIAEVEEKTVGALYEGLKANPGVLSTDEAEREVGEMARQNDIMARDLVYRQDAAKRVQEARSHEELVTDTERQKFAGFDVIDEHGVQRVANIAQQKEADARSARVNAAIATFEKVEPTLEVERAIILGDASKAGQFAHLVNDTDSRSGALRHYIGRAPINDIQTLIENLDISSDADKSESAAILRSELMAALEKRGGPIYISAKNRTMSIEGKLSPEDYKGANGTNTLIKAFLESGGFDAKSMATGDRDDIKRIYRYIREYGISDRAKNHLITQLRIAYDPDGDFAGTLGKRDLSPGELGDIWKEVGLPDNKQEYIKRTKRDA